MLLYVMNLILALVLSIPIAVAFSDTVGPTGFGPDLAAGFDIVLWADIIEEVGDTLSALQFQLLWMVPLYLIWKAAASVGLIHALRGDQFRPFWQGVSRYTARALLLGLLFLILTALGVLATFVVMGLLNSLWPGAVGAFWVNLVLAPTLLISLVAVLDLMHDYARIALVYDEQPVFTALGTGLMWPFRHGQASVLYLIWFAPAALLWLLPFVFDMNVTGATGFAIWALFLTQQVLLLLRAAITVGWYGSETAFYETIRLQEMPLIADESGSAFGVQGSEFGVPSSALGIDNPEPETMNPEPKTLNPEPPPSASGPSFA